MTNCGSMRFPIANQRMLRLIFWSNQSQEKILQSSHKQGFLLTYKIYYLFQIVQNYRNNRSLFTTFYKYYVIFLLLMLTYTNAKELLLAKQRNNDSYGYFYGDQNNQGNLHRLRSAQSEQTKIGMYYSYDGKGNVIDTKMGVINDSGEINTTVSANPYLQTIQGYSSNGNYRTSASDQRGNITTYSINAITGLIHSVTDPKGYQTSYTYDSDNYFLTEVSALSSAGTVTVSYEYDEADLLSKITHNGFDYYFGYDGFGNTVNIKVGTKNLITHVYETGNGNLLYSLYGNNYKISYGYDPYNRVISVQKNNAPTYQYDYDARGNLARVCLLYTSPSPRDTR